MKHRKHSSSPIFRCPSLSAPGKHRLLLTVIALILLTIATLIITRHFCGKKDLADSFENKTQEAFDQYAHELFLENLSDDALSMHFYILYPENFSLENVEQTLGSYSYDDMVSGQQYYIDEIQFLKSLDYDSLNPKQQLTYDTLMDYFQCRLDFADLCLCAEDLSPTTGIQTQLPILFSEYAFNNKADIDHYLSLLWELNDYLGQVCEFQKIKAENNCFISDFCCQAIIDQCGEFISTGDPEDNLLYSSFNEKIKNSGYLTEEEQKQYQAKNESAITESVIPAYKNIIQTLSSLMESGQCTNSNGLYYLDGGQDYYEFLVKTYTGSSLSVWEIKSEIQDALVEDMRSMYSIFSISPELEDQFYGDVQNSMSPDEILTDLEKVANEDFPIPDSVNYEIKYVDESMEDFLSPAFYLSAPIDAPHRNIIYINQSSHFQNQDLYTTLAHEGIPGHMLQAYVFFETDPLPIRHLLSWGGYTEGWATYVEFLSYEYEYENSQLAQAFACSASYSLALYSLCDIGINYEGWTIDDTEDFLANYNLTDPSVCETIFQAVVEEPANYLQYYVGYLEILNLKSLIMKTEGSAFNLKKFHQAFLSVGPTSFDVLEKWIGYEYKQLK